MSDGGGSTTTTASSQPWSGAQPYLSDIMSQAKGLYNQGTSYAPFNTVAPFSPATQQGLDMTAQRAINGSPIINTASQSLQNLMQPRTAPGSDTLQSLISGYNDPGTALTQQGASATNAALPYAAMLAQSGPNMAGNSVLQNGATGGYSNAAIPGASGIANQDPNSNPATRYLGAQASTESINPYLDRMYAAASKPVIDSVNARAGMAGRTGSGADQQLLTRNLGDMASTMYGQNYQQAVQNQQSAANSIQGAYDNSQGRGLQATSLLGNLSGQDISNRLSSANNLNSANLGAYNAQGNAAQMYGGLGENQANRALQGGNQLSASAANQAQTRYGAANSLNANQISQGNQSIAASTLAPEMAGQDYTNLQSLLDVGGRYDAQANSQLADLKARFDYGQQQPWNLLNYYSGAVTGMGGLGGNKTTTAQQPSQSVIPSLLGTGVNLLSSSANNSGQSIFANLLGLK
jgi:hypothetical protein